MPWSRFNRTGSVGSAEIATDAVGADEIAANAVAASEIAAGAVAESEIESTVAGYLGLSSGATTRRWNVSAATERTTTSNLAVDVTGASLNISDAVGNFIFFVITFEFRTSNSGTNSLISATTDQTLYGTFGAVSPWGAIFVGNGATEAKTLSTSYVAGSFCGGYVSPSTRTTNIKVRFASEGGAATAYIKNVVIKAWAVTP